MHFKAEVKVTNVKTKVNNLEHRMHFIFDNPITAICHHKIHLYA